MPKTDRRIPRDMAKAITGYEAEATKILQAFINTVEAKKPPRFFITTRMTQGWRASLKADNCVFPIYSP